MSRIAIASTAAFFSIILGGCAFGPIVPMPRRLPPQVQASVDYGWDHLVAAGAAVNHEGLLDAILLHEVWHRGVDRLHLTSEKQVGDTRVILETEFVREQPESDRFTIRFVAGDGTLYREDVFTRADLECAMEAYATPDEISSEASSAEWTAHQVRVAERDARFARGRELFPMPEDCGDDRNLIWGRIEIPTAEPNSTAEDESP